MIKNEVREPGDNNHKNNDDKRDYKGYRQYQDERNGIDRLDARHPVYPNVQSSIFSHWKELYSFLVRICKDELTLPRHFMGNPAAAMIVAQKGHEMGMPVMDALYRIIPMNGYLCMLGEKLKSLIFNSDVYKQGSWLESNKGSIKASSYVVTINAERIDGEKKTITFSMDQFKRAGLYISQHLYEEIKGGASKSQEIRYRFPERTMLHMAMGWMSRDLFPDVCQGLRVMEEVEQYDDYEKIFAHGTGEQILGTAPELLSKSKKRNQRLKTTLQVANDLDSIEVKEKVTVIATETDKVNESDDLFDDLGKIVIKDIYTEEEILSLKGKYARSLPILLDNRGIVMEFMPRTPTPQEKRNMLIEHQKGYKYFSLYLREIFGKEDASEYDERLRKSTEPQDKKIKLDAVDPEKATNKFKIYIPQVSNNNGVRDIEDALDIKKEIQNLIVEDEKQFMNLTKDLKKSNGRKFKNMLDFCKECGTAELNRWISKQFV